MREQLFVIHWKSLVTGYSGNGTGAFPKALAQSVVEELNRAYADLLVHWLEPKETER